MASDVEVVGLVVVLLAVLLVVYVTWVCRQTRALTKAALTEAVSEPIELICGMRYRGTNATWPECQIRIDDFGVEFSGIGATEVATWADVSAVRLVRPLTLMGWGLTYLLTNPARTITIWLTSHKLAARVLEKSRYHGALVTSGWSLTV